MEDSGIFHNTTTNRQTFHPVSSLKRVIFNFIATVFREALLLMILGCSQAVHKPINFM